MALMWPRGPRGALKGAWGTTPSVQPSIPYRCRPDRFLLRSSPRVRTGRLGFAPPANTRPREVTRLGVRCWEIHFGLLFGLARSLSLSLVINGHCNIGCCIIHLHRSPEVYPELGDSFLGVLDSGNLRRCFMPCGRAGVRYSKFQTLIYDR